MNLFSFLKKHHVGLVLGSGGSKGIAHIAVIEYLESMEIPVHMMSGASIGAGIGALYAAGSLKQFKNDLLSMKWKQLITYFDPVFPRSGLLEGVKLIEFLKNYIPADERIENLSIPLSIVATDLTSGSPVIFKSGNVLEALRASISIPGVFIPVKHNDTYLVDGGVSNPLPIDIVREMGADLTIAVNLNPEIYNVRKSRNAGLQDRTTRTDRHAGDRGTELGKKMFADSKGTTQWLQAAQKWIGSMKKGKDEDTAPNIFNVISKTIDIMSYANAMQMLKFNPPTVLIEPNLLEFNSLDFSQANRGLTEGFNAASRVHAQLQKKIKRRV